jgi:hypothetical protein
MIIYMLAPGPNMVFTSTPSGSVYTADGNGLITILSGSVADQAALQLAGCYTLNAVPNVRFLGKLIGANFNVTTDQQILITASGSWRFRIKAITAENTSVPGMSTAAGGIYPAAGKSGTAIVAAGQVYTGMTNADTALDLTLAVPNQIYEPAVANTVFFSLTTPQGAAATADLYAWGDVYTS